MKFTENGFYIEKTNDQYKIGLSDKGQDEFGEVGFVNLATEEIVTTDTVLVSIEASKAVSSVPSPLAGKVVSYNETLEDNPEYLNSTDLDKNWIAVLTDVNEADFDKLADESGLE